MRSARVLVSILFSVCMLGVAGSASAQTLTSGGGLLFDFISNGEMSNGTTDAYDNCYYLQVGTTMYSGGATTLSGRTVTFPVQSMSGLNVSRIAYVPATGGDWARYLDILQNPGTSPVTVDVTIGGNLGSDSGTFIRGSSTGDLMFTTADDWLQTNDSFSDPALAHVVQGPGALNRTTVETLVGDQITWTFHVTVPAGGRAVVMTFAVQMGDLDDAGAQATATSLVTLPDTATAGAEAYLPDVVNFLTSSPCSSPEGTACTSATGATGKCHMSLCCTGCWDGTACHPPGTASACGVDGVACISCVDTNSCSDDVCSRTTGLCSHPATATGTSCNDGNYCTLADTCNGSSLCVGMGSPCDDGNSCTTDACTEATDTCTHTPLADGASCGTGICHASICCSGCWNGTSCQPGIYSGACGAGGAACASCIDGDSCTDDICSAGACMNPLSSTGTPCDDGLYCTTGDHCDGADTCVSGTGTPCDDGSFCTTDTCDESINTCMHAATAGDCAIFGTCFMSGDRNPSNRCQVCDPAMNPSGWTIAVGMDCGMPVCGGSMLTPAPTCSATGTCMPGTRAPCPTGLCADGTTCAAACTMDSDCGSTGYCDVTTGMCVGRIPPGGACSRSTMCAVGACAPEGVCCATACSGTCVSCTTAGNIGRCLPVATGTDPDDECPGAGACNGSGACGSAPDLGMPDLGGSDTDGGGTTTDGSVTHGDGAAADMGSMTEKAGCCGVAGGGGNDVPWALGLVGLAIVALRRRRAAC